MSTTAETGRPPFLEDDIDEASATASIPAQASIVSFEGAAAKWAGAIAAGRALLVGSSQRRVPRMPRLVLLLRRRAPRHVRHRRSGTRFPDGVALTCVGVLASIMAVWNLTGAPSYQEDEGTYTAQAFSVLSGSLAPYTYWYDHPPLGWVQLGALAWIPKVLGLGDGTYIGSTRYVVSLYFVATAILLYLLTRRLRVRLPFAVIAVVVFVLSPLSLVLGRQVYLDNIGMTWLLGAFYLALSTRKALWHHIAAGALFAVAVLSKETLAIFGPALLFALVNRPAWSNRAFSVVGFLCVGGLVLSFYPLMAALRGELFSGAGHVSLQDALAYQFLERSGSGTIWEAGSSRAELLEGWLYFDKYLIAVGIVAALVCLFRRRYAWITLAVVAFAVPVVLGEGYLPAMYIVGLLPFLALALGGALDILWSQTSRLLVGISPRVQSAGRGLVAGIIATGLVVMAVPQWVDQDRTLLAGNANKDWTAALEWAKHNLPRDETVLAPYSMWQDLNSDGWSGVWSVIVTEKVDLDSQFDIIYPEGWKAIDWVIVGPIVESNIEDLALETAGQVVERSVPVVTFGEWSVNRVEK